ncbi:hypothetical protein GF371_00350 [Candidatus Woesearchaeota archaeon]|nr:hypothetical protein [Candidatus Woesearchaeota archaeon]
MTTLLISSFAAAVQKADWLEYKTGNCSMSECFLDPTASDNVSGDQQESKCKPDDWYSKVTLIDGVWRENYDNNRVADLYCGNGNWTTRTSFIAQKMLTIPAANEDYVLSCGPPSEVLVDQGIGKKAFDPTASKEKRFTNEYDRSVFNSLCILLYKGDLIVGTSFNELGNNINISLQNQIQLDEALYEAFDIDSVDLSGCSGSTNKYDFRRCSISTSGSNPEMYYNNFTQSFIYTPNGGDVLRQGFIYNLYDLFITPILNLLEITDRTLFELSPEPLEESKLFKNLYRNKNGNRLISAVIEPKHYSGRTINEYFTASYVGFSEDICESVDIYDDNVAGGIIICRKDGNRQTIFTVSKSSTFIQKTVPVSFVKDMTHGMRLQ